MWECQTCDRTFRFFTSCEQHMQAKLHWSNYCQPCNLQFGNANSYRAHLNSGTHRGKEVDCQYCDAEFVTSSGVLHHLESGSCPEAPDKNRSRLYRDIQRLDTTGRITNGAWYGDHWECDICDKEFYRGGSAAVASHMLSPVHNGELYHCLNVSDNCNKTFVSLAAVFNHMESESCGYLDFEDVPNCLNRLLRYVDGGVGIPAWSLDQDQF
ncbi:unnamed protein product [Penicillium salamii]|nr:unnamed protein product [Penicillium salamii]